MGLNLPEFKLKFSELKKGIKLIDFLSKNKIVHS